MQKKKRSEGGVTTVKEIVMKIVNTELEHARKKHPVFPSSFSHQVAIVGEEFGEFAQATNDAIEVMDESNGVPTVKSTSIAIKRMVECGHVIATSIRTLETFLYGCEEKDVKKIDDLYNLFCKIREDNNNKKEDDFECRISESVSKQE